MTNSDFLYFIEKTNWETGINANLSKKYNLTIKCLKYVNTGALMAYNNSVYLVTFEEANNLYEEHKISIITHIT